MRRVFSLPLAAALVVGCAVAQAAPVTADIGYTVDQDGGHALDLDLGLAPTEHLTLHAGAGRSRAGEKAGGLTGNLFNVGASLHGERAGLALSFDTFDDSSNYQADTLAARAWFTAADFEFALLARQRDLAVEVTLELPLRTVRRELAFSATGVGLQVGYSREQFSAYVMALEYDYDREFDDFLDLIGSPQLERRPRIEALVGSFITQTQGAIDRQAGAGCEFGFERNSLAVDLSFVHDAVLDAGSRSLSLTWRRAQTVHVDWGVSAGLVDSDTFGSIGFLGAQFGLAN